MMDGGEPEVAVADKDVPDEGVAEEESHDARIVCLGEALVDFVCERPVSSLVEADFFVPRQGGSLANIAMAAARFSDRVELIGGVGDDQWGLWLHERITIAGVDTSRFDLLRGVQTSHAFVSVDDKGEPSFAFYGDKVRPSAHAGVHLEAAISGDDGVLVVGSDTLLGAEEREVTMRAVALAREQGWAILCDPNLRPDRWNSRDEMIQTISALIAGADVVKLNESEATALSGMISAEAGGEWLMSLGPRAVVVTTRRPRRVRPDAAIRDAHRGRARDGRRLHRRRRLGVRSGCCRHGALAAFGPRGHRRDEGRGWGRWHLGRD